MTIVARRLFREPSVVLLWYFFETSMKRPRKFRRLSWARVRRLVLATLLAGSAIVVAFVGSFRWLNPPTTAFMLQDPRAGESGVRYDWVEFENMSRYLPIAVVAAEDQTFPQHRGFDVQSIRSALEENQTRARPRGASTITQQVAKNLFLWPGQSFVRKGIEAGLTLLIELTWPKRRILEVYLNVAQFGPGLYGVGAASDVYFSKPASTLELDEAAVLAAVLPNAVSMHADDPSDYVVGRAEDIQEQVRLLGGPGYLDSLDAGAGRVGQGLEP